MRIRIAVVVAGLLLAFASAAVADGFQKGSNLFAIQIGEGTADLIGPESFSSDPGYVSAYDHSELGVQGQFIHFLSDSYALNLTGGVGFFSETDKPGKNAAVGDRDFKYTQTSWQVRLGGDRVCALGEKFHLFIGPGLQVWGGKAKFEGGAGPAGPSVESGNTLRIALQGRLAIHYKMSDHVGMFSQLGHYFGYATGKDKSDKDAKATWWPSGHDGAAGLAFTF